MRFQEYLTEEYDVDQVLEMVERNCSDIFNIMKDARNALWRGITQEPSSNIIEMVPRTDRKPKDTKQWLHDKLDDAFKEKFGWRVRSEGIFATSSSNMADQFGKSHMFFPFDGFKYVWSIDVHDLTERFINVNYNLDKLDDTALKLWAIDDFLEVSKPDLQTGKGQGYWSIEKGLAELDDIEGIIKYYKKYNTDIEIVTVMKAFSHWVVEYKVDGKKEYAYWVPSIRGEDYKRLSKIAAKNIQIETDKRIKKVMKDYTDKDIKKAIYSMNEISFKCDRYYIVHERMWGRLFVDHIRGYR